MLPGRAPEGGRGFVDADVGRLPSCCCWPDVGRELTSGGSMASGLPETKQDILIIIHSTSIRRFSEAVLHE